MILIYGFKKQKPYKQQTSFRILTGINMSEPSNSRVEFFNSEQSFGSASYISNSGPEFLLDEMIIDTQDLFSALKDQLRPDPKQNRDKVRLIINRAKIMCKQTMPNFIHENQLKKSASLNLQKIKNSQARLEDLIQDYSKCQSSHNEFERFYQKYSNAINKFTKKVGSRPMEEQIYPAQPDIINNLDHSPVRSISNHNNLAPKTAKVFSKDESNDKLRNNNDQIIELKNKIKQLEESNKITIQQLKTETYDRIHKIINTYSLDQGTISKTAILEKELSQVIIERRQLNEKNKDLLINIERYTKMLQKKTEQVNNMKEWQEKSQESKRRNQGSRVLDQSIHSQYNPSGNDQMRKMHRMIKNLEYENLLLHNELKKQRQSTLKQKKQQNNDKIKQIFRLKSMLETESKELKDTKIKLDLSKVEIIKLRDRIDKTEKSNRKMELDRVNATPLLNSGNNFYEAEQENKISRTVQEQMYEIQQRTVIQSYIGDGNEGLPYYEFLNKQERIRFRRSCLREKQLLMKTNGLEVGVICQFSQPNQIKVTLYLANFDHQSKIKNLILKITNSKNNKITLENSQFELLDIERQSRSFVGSTIKHYPIGCTLLICEYDYYDKRQEGRILLPIHMFKMLKFRAKSQNFTQPVQMKPFPLERKIGKDIEALSAYFKGAKIQNHTIKCLIIHEHTQTFLIAEFIVEGGFMSITYEHKSGQQSMTHYIIKSLTFLLRKEDKQ